MLLQAHGEERYRLSEHLSYHDLLLVVQTIDTVLRKSCMGAKGRCCWFLLPSSPYVSTACLPLTTFDPLFFWLLSPLLCPIFSLKLTKGISTKIFFFNFDLIKNIFSYFTCNVHFLLLFACFFLFVVSPDICYGTALFSVIACSHSTLGWAIPGLKAQSQAQVTSGGWGIL